MDDAFLAWIAELAAADPHAPPQGDDGFVWRLFAEPEAWLAVVDEAEAAKIVWNAARDLVGVLLTGPRRAEGLDVLYRFFAGTLAPRCADELGRPSSGPTLSGASYMFFDLFDLRSCVGEDAALAFFARLLALSSAACQEAALHGLGHFHEQPAGLWAPVRDPDPRVVAIIDAAKIHPSLAEYAQAAREGNVL